MRKDMFELCENSTDPESELCNTLLYSTVPYKSVSGL